MRQAGVIAAAGVVALETMVERLADDHARARRLADAMATRWPGSVDPARVRTNIVCADLRALPAEFVARLGRGGVRAGTIDPRTVRLVTHKDVDDDAITVAIAAFDELGGGLTVLYDEIPDARARDLRASRRPRDLGGWHARALGRRRRRGARRRHDARRQGHERSRRRPRRARPACASRRRRPRRGSSVSPSIITSTIPTARSSTTARCGSSWCGCIRSVRPDVVCCPDPTAVFFGDAYVNHRDHRVTGWATLDAVAPAAGNPHYFPELTAEGLEVHQVQRVATCRARSNRTSGSTSAPRWNARSRRCSATRASSSRRATGSATSCARARSTRDAPPACSSRRRSAASTVA